MNKKPSLKLKVGVGYIRESTEEQDKGFSPDNQKRTIEEYAAKHNIQITEWYKDLLSGRDALKRDDFQRMVTDAMQKKFEVILVFHTSRFARNVKEARHYKELMRKKLGIDVLSVTQNFGNDWNDPSSFLNEGINELFDEHQSRQISFWVRTSLMEKRTQGKQVGNPPIGYYKKKLGFDKENNRPMYSKEWLVHPEEAKLVKKIYSIYSTGRLSYADVAVEINKDGMVTKQGHPFTYSSIKDILSNQVYLGKVYSRRKGYPTIKGIHPAILNPKMFAKVQEVVNARRNTQGRPVAQHRFYLLQDLVYCWHCRKYLYGKEDKASNAPLVPKMYCETHMWTDAKGKRHEKLMYHCKIRRENRSCNQAIVPVEIIDNQIIALMDGFNLPNDVIEMSLSKLRTLFKQVSNSPKDLSVVAKLNDRKRKIKFIFENTDQYTEDEYLGKLKEIDTELAKYDGLGLVNNNVKIKEAEALKKTEKFLRDFKQFWKLNIGDEERQEWIRMTIKRVWVKDKKVVAIEPHDDFKPLFVTLKKVLVQSPSPTPYKER